MITRFPKVARIWLIAQNHQIRRQKINYRSWISWNCDAWRIGIRWKRSEENCAALESLHVGQRCAGIVARRIESRCNCEYKKFDHGGIATRWNRHTRNWSELSLSESTRAEIVEHRRKRSLHRSCHARKLFTRELRCTEFGIAGIAAPRDWNCTRAEFSRLEIPTYEIQLRENVGIVERINYIRIKKKIPRTTTKYRRLWRKVETENKRLYDKKSIIRWSMEENWAQHAFIGSDGHNYAIMMRIIFAIRAS